MAFLNVGQGDCAVVEADDGWRAIFDGGREHELEPFEPYLRRLGRVDLLVGTHFDADHLEGLCWLVENGLPTRGIRRAIVPAQPHPDGDRVEPDAEARSRGVGRPSALLADHFAAGRGLADVYGSLEERARRSERSLTFLRRSVRGARMRRGSSAVRADRSSGRATELARAAGLTALASLVEGSGQVRVLGDRAVARHPLVRGVGLVERELISASTLKRLVEALNVRSIPWSAAVASDEVAPLAGRRRTRGPTLWHLSPAARYVAHYARHVAAVWDKVFRVMDAVDTGLPTLSNRLSHVIVAEDAAGRALAICGDSGFQHGRRVPDSLADGWEEPFGGVSLLHLPHHAGRWGRFGARARSVLGDVERPLAMYASVGHRRANPPGRAVVPFVRSVVERRGEDGVLFVANRPAGTLGRLVRDQDREAAEGPPILMLQPDGDAWSAEGLDHRGEAASTPPITVRLS